MTTAQPTKPTAKPPGLQLVVADNRLSVVLSCDAAFAARPDAVEAVSADLIAKGIKKPVDATALGAALANAVSTQSGISNFVLIQGIEPTAPQDARLEWSRDFFAQGYYVDPVTHRIDYHRKAASKAVQKDDVLGVVQPSQPGKSGEDVFGKSIAPGRP
ncbi:MAG: DUF342 domain-containing protein, partial [candidate division Zixibacteria bacterium]|nr:DUF342 domain-containing protein [candidate division Zixibacteria bacterium]